MKETTTLDDRLQIAADFVREGALFADIGTDHGYLPIALVESGKIKKAIAADVAVQPLEKAKSHIAAVGLSDAIQTVLTDGLAGLEPYHPTDIALCGMGGELIARILGDAPFVKNAAIRLILQPMTMQPYLRRWLWDNGYCMEDERVAYANGKLYPVFLCHYDGIIKTYTAIDADFGICNRFHMDNEKTRAYCQARIERIARIIDGKKRAEIPCTEEEALHRTLSALLSAYK